MSGTDDTNKRYPESTFYAEYPYNQATVTRSGHEFHVNDTPDHESLKISHTTGTYVEIEKTGRWKHTVVEKVYNYFKNTFTQTVDSHCDIKIGGTYTHNVDKSSFESVALDKTVGVQGNLIDIVGSVRQIHTENDRSESVNGTLSTAVRGDHFTQVDGSYVTNVAGAREDAITNSWLMMARDAEISTTNDFAIQCNNFEVRARQNVNIKAGSGVVIESGGPITITTAAGPITVTAQGIVYINGTQIRLND
jgi:hypothetical protein